MTPAPSVQVYCYLPRIDHGEWVHFLIDTGASESCLHGHYALDIQHRMLPETLSDSCGIGGDRGYFHEKTGIVFWDDRGEPLLREVDLGIQCIQKKHLANPDILQFPCLLGRDILNKCVFHYNYSRREVYLIFR